MLGVDVNVGMEGGTKEGWGDGERTSGNGVVFVVLNITSVRKSQVSSTCDFLCK